MENKDLIKEFEFCLDLWEKQGHCSFGGYNKCENCAVPYLLYKFITGEVIHGDNIKRLTLEDWKEKLKEIKK
ncbi:MAG: hypothetical protein WC356_03135 [Candidatus Micrarchaeia archaeon]|jgi:hypothetical protein